MEVCYALQPIKKSIFLAGPTPREDHVVSWRPEAIAILSRLGFEGTVFVPETADWAKHEHYDNQIAWEWEALNVATTVVFWVPRKMATLPALTTNVEFGLCAATGKCVLGYPGDAVSVRYLDRIAQRHNITVCSTLEDTLSMAIAHSKNPFGYIHD